MSGDRDLMKIKTKGGLLVLNQCDHFRFEIGFFTVEDEMPSFSLFLSLKTLDLTILPC